MVMKIESGKFYKTRDGRKVGPMRRQSNGWVADSGRIDDNGAYDWYMSGNYDCYNQETSVDLIAEWQDEQKKEISDMSEVKFKVGDLVTQKETKDYVYKVIAVDREGLYAIEIVEDIVSSMVGKIYSAVTDRNLELYKVSSNNIPEPNTKWVFNDGRDFVVRVVGFNDKGQIVLEALSDENCGGWLAGDLFTFENEPEKFGEFYKPWVEKVEEPTRLVGYVRVVKSKINGRLDFDVDLSDTEQEARDGFDSWDGAWELVDVVKVEWEQP